MHVKTNMMAILMVAAQKGFWQADENTLRQVAQAWADLLLKNGLPGSGHTRYDHPVFEWVMPKLREDQRAPLKAMLEKARVEKVAQPAASPSTITEAGAAQASARRDSGRAPPNLGLAADRRRDLWAVRGGLRSQPL